MSGNQRGGIIFRLLGLLTFVAFLAVLYLLRHPLLRAAGGFWVVEDPIAHSDAILVIGDDDFAGDRAFRAADLYRAGQSPEVVASGRRLRPYSSEAELISHDLVSDGVPSTAVIRFDHDATDTLDEARALRRLVVEKHWNRILLVTSNYHTRRARLIFTTVFPPQVSIAVVPARDPAYDPDTWWEHRSGLKLFFMECAAYGVARWELRHPPA
jgi:uncharacterized SAM-binding protein YcdF (DUF218 family)